MQRSEQEVGQEDGLDQWGEWIGGEVSVWIRRVWVGGECVDGEPVSENSPWVCVWLSDRSGWTGDRLGLRRLARWSSGWAWRDRREVDRCRWLDQSSRSFSRSLAGLELSVAGSKLSFFLSLIGWIGALILSLALSVFCVLYLALCVFCSLSLCCSFSRSFCVLHSFSRSFCVLRDLEMIWSENEIVKSFLSQRSKFRSTRSDFPKNFIFRCCQTCRFGGKWLPEIIFPPKKCTLIYSTFNNNFSILVK